MCTQKNSTYTTLFQLHTIKLKLSFHHCVGNLVFLAQIAHAKESNDNSNNSVANEEDSHGGQYRNRKIREGERGSICVCV